MLRTVGKLSLRRSLQCRHVHARAAGMPSAMPIQPSAMPVQPLAMPVQPSAMPISSGFIGSVRFVKPLLGCDWQQQFASGLKLALAERDPPLLFGPAAVR